MHARDRVAGDVEALDRRRPAERRAARAREHRELDGERVRIAGFVGCGVDAAGEPVAARGERRLERDAFVGRAHDAIAAVLTH
ncbi:MAG TPA: hypothetical protein VII68_17930 [Casimicrobiaceae bacterium]